MPNLRGYAKTVNPVSDIACAYASSTVTLRASTPAEPAWVVIGSFTVPESLRARLEVIALVAPDTTVEVALYGPSKMVNSSVYFDASAETRKWSAVCDLAPNVIYQIAALVQAAAADDEYFATIRTVSLGGV